MKVVSIEEYIHSGGLKNILQFKNKDELVALFTPSWVDNLKKGKTRINYLGVEGTLEILFHNESILNEHFDLENNNNIKPACLTLQSRDICFGKSKEDVFAILRTLGLEVNSSNFSDNYQALKLSNNVVLGFLDNKLVNIDINYIVK